MVTVEITDSNLDFFQEYDLIESISYSEFQEISINMQVGDIISFSLFHDGKVFYKGSFSKKEDSNSVTEDILFVLKTYKRQKKLSAKEFRLCKSLILDALKSEKKTAPSKKHRARMKLPAIKFSKKAIPWKYLGIAFFVCIASAAVILLLNSNDVNDKKAEPVVTLDKYLIDREYQKAAERYPESIQDIENELFHLIQSEDEAYLDDLQQFQEHYPTVQGEFDLAMFDYDYDQAISVYEKNPEEIEQSRLLLVGYAYLKIDQLENAKRMFEVSENAELEKLILQYQQLMSIISEKEKEIKELEKKPTENKAKISQAIEELYQTKKELNQL